MDLFDDDPAAAVSLFEMAAPELPPPVAVMREMSTVPDVVRFSLRAKGAVYRMKLGAGPVAAARLVRGSALLGALAGRGIPAPRPVLVLPRFQGTELSVAVEMRLGTTDGASAWPTLGTPARIAVAEDAARGLALLHAQEAADLPPLGAPAPERRRPWREMLLSRVDRQVDRLRGADLLPSALVARVEERLGAAARLLPPDLDRRPCHGAYGLDSVALDRRTFTGLRDLETACLGDPWMDVAHWLGSTGEPDSSPARRFMEAYAERVPPPPDLPSRIDLYAGLTVLRSMAHLAEAFSDEGRAAMMQVTEAWVSSPPRLWE